MFPAPRLLTLVALLALSALSVPAAHATATGCATNHPAPPLPGPGLFVPGPYPNALGAGCALAPAGRAFTSTAPACPALAADTVVPGAYCAGTASMPGGTFSFCTILTPPPPPGDLHGLVVGVDLDNNGDITPGEPLAYNTLGPDYTVEVYNPTTMPARAIAYPLVAGASLGPVEIVCGP